MKYVKNEKTKEVKQRDFVHCTGRTSEENGKMMERMRK